VGRERLSLEKLYDLLAGRLIKAADIAAVFDFDPYTGHVMRDKRRRRSPVQSGIRGLNLTRRGRSVLVRIGISF
jgi:hypothetical protein